MKKRPFAILAVAACLLCFAASQGRAADAPPKGAMRLFKVGELNPQPAFNKSLIVENCGPYFVVLKSPTGNDDSRLVFYYEKYQDLPVKEVVSRSHLRVRTMEIGIPMVEYGKDPDGFQLIRINLSKSDQALASCLPEAGAVE